MSHPSTTILLARSALAAAAVAVLSACSGADPSSSATEGAALGHSSSAQTAVWTQAYIGDAHAGSVNKKSNIQAKAALVLASDGANLSLALYFCGKGNTLSSDTQWLTGRVPLPPSGNIADLNGVNLTSKAGWKAYVSMSGPGTVTRDDGVTFEWVASYVGDGSTYGLYRDVLPGGADATGADLTGSVLGYIAWNGGSQGALQRKDDTVFQVTPVGPGAVDEQMVTFPNATAPLLVAPVDPIALTNPSL
ncbi:MAG TPA: hypothetical protein VGI39_29250 [Polyangiaceae bacterium]|jgi:hypothetical protein